MDTADTAVLASQVTPDATLTPMTGYFATLDEWMAGIGEPASLSRRLRRLLSARAAP